MSEKKKTSTEAEIAIYQLKIGIAGAHPPIWRRVLVPANNTLADLHKVIQILMGWYDDHLHQFETPGPAETNLKTRRSRVTARLFASTTDPLGEPFDWMIENLGDEAKAILQEIAPTVKTHFLYIYDMGDYWEHDILVEKILFADSEDAYPLCLTGKRNGPIEDCGGIWSYEAMLEVLADPTHEEHRDCVAWLKGVYGVSMWDAEAFDLEDINKRLKKLRPVTKSPAKRIPRKTKTLSS